MKYPRRNQKYHTRNQSDYGSEDQLHVYQEIVLLFYANQKSGLCRQENEEWLKVTRCTLMSLEWPQPFLYISNASGVSDFLHWSWLSQLNPVTTSDFSFQSFLSLCLPINTHFSIEIPLAEEDPSGVKEIWGIMPLV